MTEAELYKKLGRIIKEKDTWEENIPFVSSLLSHESVKIRAKALWMMGEMGLGKHCNKHPGYLCGSHGSICETS